VKDARRSQPVKIAGVLIRDHVLRDIVNPRMQDTPTMRQIGAVWPEIPFVLIAPNTSIDQVVLVVTSTCGSRPIMIEGKLAAHGDLGYTAVAASSLKALSNSFR